MSLVSYSTFYRKYGIYKPDQLITPPLPRLTLLSLPKESIYHYPGVGPLDDGPTPDESVFNLNMRSIYVQNITELKSIPELGGVKGSPRRVNMDVDSLARKYRAKYPRLLKARDLQSATREENTIFVYNYAYVHRLYKYTRNMYTAYHKWSNLTACVWSNIASVAGQTSRHQFIEVTLPQVLPSVSNLKMAEGVVNQKTVQLFNSSESLMLLEIWKWLGNERSTSALSLVDPKHYDKINFIFRESGRWFVLNLGFLDGLRKSTKVEALVLEKPHLKGFEADQIQKRFLRLMVSLFEARTGNEIAENLEVVDDVISAANAALKDSRGNVLTPNANPSQPVEPISGSVKTAPVLSSPMGKKTQGADSIVIDTAEDSRLQTSSVTDDDGEVVDGTDISNTVLTEDAYGADFDQQIDADLEKLEDITGNVVNDAMSGEQGGGSVNGVMIKIKEVRTLENSIIEHCNRLADNGGLSAAEYRKYMEMAGTYKTIIAPNGETLDKFINVTKELTEIKQSPSLPDKKTVLDKTMLQSSLLEFDKRYVNNVLQRDIAGMVTNMQHAGIVITDYSVEEVEDITGSHTIHEVKIKPLQGTASTLHFKIPKVDDEGTFKSNNVSYRVRKQRGDAPIRKISPIRVALTSYYGKVFAERSQKRVNNYGRWLCNNVMQMAFSLESDLVTNLAPGDCFNPNVELPRLYTILAQSFIRFTLKVIDQGNASFWDMSFDHKNRQAFAGGVDLTALEEDGSVVVGRNGANELMVMGMDGVLYRVQQGSAGNTLVALPPLEDILGINGLKTPLDFAELKVFGKMIPIGVILSYLVGLDEVVKAVNVTPRIVAAGTRTQITSDEWAIVFQDETWIFPRENELASMVLGGWRDYKQSTVTYNAHEFNKRDVYLNVLESAELGVRYLRELDLMSQMFVDPITKELLLEMGEPTDFEGLLYRSCNMLLVDQHPNELDSQYMRIKGYERFAGTVYSELVRSIRTHNGRPGKTRYPVELNPYAVWIQIQQDPAKNQVIEINPIQNLKEAEAVTYTGTGGRNSRSMTKKTRIYHPSDMGTISESTVDNSDVGINTFLCGDPQFNSLRGTARRYKIGETGATGLLSTSALLSVGATVDDPKRV